MTILCAILAISTVLAWCGYEFYRNRAANLEILNSDLRDQLQSTQFALDDITRERDHYRHLHASLLAENNTLLVDLMHTERMCVFYRSRRRRNKEAAAGLYLLEGWARPNKKATLMTMESTP